MIFIQSAVAPLAQSVECPPHIYFSSFHELKQILLKALEGSESDPNVAYLQEQLDQLGSAPKRLKRTPAEQQQARDFAMQKIASGDVSAVK